MLNLSMSSSVVRQNVSREWKTRQDRKLCRQCGRRKALFTRYTWKRRVKRDRYHDLCFQCWRAVRDAARNRAITRVLGC